MQAPVVQSAMQTFLFLAIAAGLEDTRIKKKKAGETGRRLEESEAGHEVHGHPKTEGPRSDLGKPDEAIEELQKKPEFAEWCRKCTVVKFDQCATGLRTGHGPVKELTVLITTSQKAKERFEKKVCRCKVPHQRFVGGPS